MLSRNRFYDLNLSECRQRGVEFLSEVKAVLDDNNIVFWIEYGTLLGAVRQQGFILWDSEIDLGFFKDDLVDLQFLLSEFRDRGITCHEEPDRIKLLKDGWEIGAFTVDIHLYNTAGDQAYISYAKPVLNFYDLVINKLCWILSLYDRQPRVIYRFSIIIKLIGQYFTIYDSLPFDEIKFRPGMFNNENSFELKIANNLLKSRAVNTGANLSTRILVSACCLLPLCMLRKFKIFFDMLRRQRRYCPARQVFPNSFFKNLKQLKLYDIELNCPSEASDYLCFVYGTNWRIPDHGWKRENMHNIRW